MRHIVLRVGKICGDQRPNFIKSQLLGKSKKDLKFKIYWSLNLYLEFLALAEIVKKNLLYYN